MSPFAKRPSISEHDASNGVNLDIKAEVDDERRDVPPGWVRAFDRASGHHFYAPTDPSMNATSTWIHPYDSPAFLATLPSDHPAHPASEAAKFYQQRSATEQAAQENGKKGWLSKAVGKVKGDGVSYDEKVHQKDAEDKFVRRREALKAGDLTAFGTEQKYAPDPFGRPTPSEPFNRFPATNVQYAYGYQGAYQRKYTPALGYGHVDQDGPGMSKTTDWYLHGPESLVAGNTQKKNYGF